MTSHAAQTAFLDRFEGLRSRLKRVRIATALATAGAALIAIVAVIALLDYRYELPWNSRAAGLAVAGLAVSAWLLSRVWQIVARWSRPRTAGELEERFPELGQRFRTAVQYGRQEAGALRQSGVAPSLVDALEADTSERSAPIELDAVVPVRRCYATAAVTVLAAVCLMASLRTDWQWRTAVQRALLADTPYTTLRVTPGNTDLDEGNSLAVTATLAGRTNRSVVLLSRPAGRTGAAWTERTLEPAGSAEPGSREVSFSASLSKISEPLEYRVVAGPAASDVFRVQVRYPLAIANVSVEVQPPEYTGLPASTVPEGDITALQGSRARFRVELDRAPASAEAVMQRVGTLEDGEQREFRIPLDPEGSTLAWELDLTRDLRWSIDARSPDGTRIRDHAFRVRVREDQPPRVGFESPDEQLEVHTLAEVLMRIRAADDYGLARAGIVFQINNNEEHTLLQEDFAQVTAAAAELDETGRLAPRTRALLERVLPLESFALIQKDCLIYYAFAEDNLPDVPHRSESDLRFIDIRPFKQTFRLAEPGQPGMGGGRTFTSLEELIHRQRGILNSTIRLDRRADGGSERDLGTVDRLIASQAELADLTREFAEFLLSEGADDIDMFFQAEAAMLNAVDSLSVGKYDTAALQEKDAQQYLVEARNALEILLRDAQNSASLRRALARFNRALRQKLRRDRKEQETARSLVERLVELAATEDRISRDLTGLSQSMRPGPGAAGGPAGSTEAEPAATGDRSPQTPDGETSATPPANSDEPLPENAVPDAPVDPRDLEERQYDAVAEAEEIAEALSAFDGVTELANERMQAAVRRADEAAGTLARGDTSDAARQTAEAAELFDELARHVAALLAEESPERIAMARNMASSLADQERQLAGDLDGQSPGAQEPPVRNHVPRRRPARILRLGRIVRTRTHGKPQPIASPSGPARWTMY